MIWLQLIPFLQPPWDLIRLIDNIDARLKAGLISEKQAEAQRKQIEKEAFQRNKKFAIAQAAINGALAITKILAETPKFDFGIATAIEIVAAAATTASQIAVISSQQFAKGGLVKGLGTETSDSIPARLSKNESVINANSTRKYKPILSAINVDGGGKAFARGGFAGAPTGISPVSDVLGINNIVKSIQQMNFKPIVSIEEIRRAESKVEIIQRGSTL